MKENRLAPLGPLFLLFSVFTGFFVGGKSMLVKWNAAQDVLIIGNILLLLITLCSYLLLYRGLQSANTQAFIRMIYTSFIVKFFIIIAAVFIYAVSAKELNKAGIIICMFIYLIYTFVEVSALTKLLKRKTNA
jgi:ACR3 family arsenite efflux pump ArsB